MRKFNPVFALEDVFGEVTDNTEEQEVEHVFYGKIANPQALADLAKQPYVKKCLQQQYQFKLDLGKNNADMSITIRARRVNKEGYVLTRKVWIRGENGNKERSIEVDQAVFNFIKGTAGEGIIKMRYEIQPEGWERKLQLDVFLDGTGSPTGYAKYDYEVPANNPNTPVPALPVALLDLKHLDPFRATDGDAAALKLFMTSQGVPVTDDDEEPEVADEGESASEPKPDGNPDDPQENGVAPAPKEGNGGGEAEPGKKDNDGDHEFR